MVGSKVTTKSTTRLIKVVFGNSLMQRHIMSWTTSELYHALHVQEHGGSPTVF
jgi:hypothetical protein